MALAALGDASSPPFVINIAGRECLGVRAVAERFAELLDKPAKFSGKEIGRALLSDGRKGHELFGRPRVSADRLIEWIADWIAQGGRTLGKPTHFETTDGKF